jgi:hypothetical protein
MKLRSILSIFTVVAFLVSCSTSSDTGISIDSISLQAGIGGQEVVITGDGFGNDTSDVVVRFGPVNAQVTSVTNSEIVTSVPALAPIGATTIQLEVGGENASIDFTVNDPLVGNWISEGSNLAPLLAGPPFNTETITAEFNSDATYTVVTTDTSGSAVTLTGTWSSTEGEGLIRVVTVNQASPTTLTSTGIYSNVNGVLTYEVAQTNPPLTGVTAPTASGGFGSTSGGAFGMLNVQKYVQITQD